MRFPHRWNQIDETRRSLVLAWLAFTITFGCARLVTWLIQIDTRDVGDVSAGATHLHHYLWGILLLAGVAIFGMVDRSPRARTWMGLALGGAVIDPPGDSDERGDRVRHRSGEPDPE